MNHEHDDGETCPLCPTPDQMRIRREENLARWKTEREELTALFTADPRAFVHIVEGYDDDAPREALLVQVSSTYDKAREFCLGRRISPGQVYEIRPHRIDGTSRDGNVVMAHFVHRDGANVEGEGRYFPPKTDDD